MEPVPSRPAECPFKHTQELPATSSPSLPIEPLPESKRIHVIVVEKGRDPQEDGQVITAASSDADLTGFTNAIIRRFLPSIQSTVLPSVVALEDSTGTPVKSYSQLSKLRVVYLSRPLVVQEPPLVPGYPLVGIMPYLVKDQRAALASFFNTYGNTMLVYMFSSRVVITCDPAVIREMIHESEYFYKSDKFPLSEVKELAGDGLFTTSSTDDVWKHAHRLLMPAFSSSAMKLYAEEMVNVAEKASRLAGMYGPNDPFDAVGFALKVTFQTIGQVALGYDFHLMDAIDSPTHPFLVAMNYCLLEIGDRIPRSKYWKYLPISSNHRFAKEMRTIKGIMKEVIEERRNSPDATNMKKDLLGFMLNARAPNPQGEVVGLSDENIFDQIITFGVAGSETSANTLSWILYLLDKHPDIQQRVVQELANVGIVQDRSVTVKQSSQLTYLTQVIKEALRLFPPVGLIGKVCSKDCVLPGGFIMRKDESIRISIWGLHRNPEVYPDPFRFDPERFSEQNIKKIPEGGWLPFSSGPRACIGMQFAMIEMRIVLATLLSRYVFRVADGGEVTYDTRAVTTKPEKLRLVVSKREDYPQPSADGELGAIADTAASSFDLQVL
ncbi:hypothetical protein GGI12_004342, partial [Dipsacomyces acuminosporus]